MFLTLPLILTVLFLTVEKHSDTAPVVIGLAVFLGHIVGVPFTGTGINPTRSFGPAIVTGTFTRNHWVFWVGPFLGSLFGSFIYKVFVVLEYVNDAKTTTDHIKSLSSLGAEPDIVVNQV